MMCCMIWTLPFDNLRFSGSTRKLTGFDPVVIFVTASPKEMPQIIAGNHFIIGFDPAAQAFIFLFQICCTELTPDGLVLRQFRLYRRKFRYQRFNFCLQIGNGFFRLFQQFFQLVFLFLLLSI